MKKKVVLMVLVMLTACGLLAGCQELVGCRERVVRGSGHLATNEYNFEGFTRVEVDSPVRFEITQSGNYGVEVTADDNMFDYIHVDQVGDTLTIQKERAIYANTTVLAVIRMPQLVGLNISGATRGTVSGFDSKENLNIMVSRASFLDLMDISAGNSYFHISRASQVTGEVDAANVEFYLDEACTVQLDGSADDIIVKAYGASNADLAGLEINNASVILGGASTAILNLDGRLDANLDGASNLKYIGEPTMGSIDTSGNSTVSRR